MTPFLYDTCIFHKSYREEINLQIDKKFETLMFITRANLNAIWSRQRSNIAQNATRVRKIIAGLKERFKVTKGLYFF